MSPFMNMTLFSPLPGSERLSRSLSLALALSADNRIHNDSGPEGLKGRESNVFLFCFFVWRRTTECTLVWVMEQLQAGIKTVGAVSEKERSLSKELDFLHTCTLA